MKIREQIKSEYHGEAEKLKARIGSLRARSHGFVTGEIVSFLGIIFFIVLITITGSTVARIIDGVLAVVMFGIYVVVRNRDVKNSGKIADLTHLYNAYSHEEAYLDGDFSAFDDGARYIDPKHPFTYDMDIFGKESLYQRINRTATTGGADRLAYYLSHVDANRSNHNSQFSTNGHSSHEVGGKVILNPQSKWRMFFISCGVDKKIDTGAILKSLPKLKDVAIPEYFGGKGIKVICGLLIVGLFLSIIAAIYGLVNPLLPIAWIFVNFFTVAGLSNKYLKEMLVLGNQLRGQMQPLMRLVKHILTLDTSKLQEAEESFAVLTDIVETLNLRGADVYRFFADSFGLRGIFLVSKFYHWRSMASDNLPAWIDAVTEYDVLVSVAQFRSNHPDAGEAKVIDSDDVVYEAKSLWHPFLGENAVRNDFSIKDGNFYIITGANMAGKSTFLRALGVNYILAMNGMPVFAESLTVSRFNLFTSMRTSDDLAHGISYFNAELLRLKQLLQSIHTISTEHEVLHRKTLIILDEILKGTNSLDKLNGSRMFLRAMEDKPVTGVVATHDLELSKMEEESPRFHNYCFEIELGTDVTYSYKIAPGVARNQNATYLLTKLLGKK